jgi:hypothetical protein
VNLGDKLVDRFELACRFGLAGEDVFQFSLAGLDLAARDQSEFEKPEITIVIGARAARVLCLKDEESFEALPVGLGSSKQAAAGLFDGIAQWHCLIGNRRRSCLPRGRCRLPR